MGKRKQRYSDVWSSDDAGNIAYNSDKTGNRYEANKRPDGSYVLAVKNSIGWTQLHVECPSEVSVEKVVRLVENGHVTV